MEAGAGADLGSSALGAGVGVSSGFFSSGARMVIWTRGLDADAGDAGAGVVGVKAVALWLKVAAGTKGAAAVFGVEGVTGAGGLEGVAAFASAANCVRSSASFVVGSEKTILVDFFEGVTCCGAGDCCWGCWGIICGNDCMY